MSQLKQLIITISLSAFVFSIPSVSFGQIEIVDGKSVGEEGEAPETGKKAAEQYFLKRKKPQSNSNTSRSYASGGDRYLSLHLGMLILLAVGIFVYLKMEAPPAKGKKRRK